MNVNIELFTDIGIMILQFLCSFVSGGIVFAIFRRSKDLLAQTGFAFLCIIFTVLSTVCVMVPSTMLYLFVGLILLYLKKENLTYTQIIFLLWSIINGFIVGKGLLLELFISMIIIGGVMLYAKHYKNNAYELSITCFDDACEKQVTRHIEHTCIQSELLFKTISEQGIHLELKLILCDYHILDQLGSIKGVEKAELIRRNQIW